ncbi:MAG: methyltransferase domain-containing protein [Prosthecobacter sp.]|uniref:RsmB/NOP family class I SAM-dependent RNA methyltransferase n=1 Tax=Prosthecobacter sp. TaxID=1965333 RepID=UPI001A00071F|nr:transcription antitermination factor NusB [Prosthecobacter sp.]MBE2285757.1 methyltransferase domain-containing protein [Prosthecobacter sp.]
MTSQRPPAPHRRQPVPIRGLALDVLGEWAAGDRFAAELLDQAQRECGIAGSDAAFLRDIVLTTLRNLSLLDHWIAVLTDNKHLDHRSRWGLRIGLCQLLILKVSEHAAVNETVAATGRARSLINAVLRRACRESAALLDQVDARPLETRTSHPNWLVEHWQTVFGSEKTAALCEWNQQPAPMCARINRLHPDMADASDDFIVCESLPREDLAAGKVYMQDPSTALAPRLLAPQPGQRVLDACAAPGGKTALLAQLMNNTGEIIACDVSPGRLRRLEGNLHRLQVANARIEQHDWAQDSVPAFAQDGFDRILLDVPCSNTGVMRRRVDVRWRLKPEDLQAQAQTQERLLRNTLRVLKPGGILVYSTCSIEPAENEQLVAMVLESTPGHELVTTSRSFPPDDQIDGAFAAAIGRI